MTLQLGGVVVLILRLQQTGTLFNAHITGLFNEWLRARPGRNVTVHVAGGAVIAGSASVRAHGTVKWGPDATVEQRLAHLETTVENLDTAVFHLGGRVETAVKETRAALEAERQERKASDEEIRGLLARAQAEFLPWELVGAFWILTGLTLAVISDAI